MKTRTMRTTALLATSLCFVLGQAASAAAPCRDAKGKFVTCPAPAAAKKTCRDAKGKFNKCGAIAPTR